MTIKVLHTPGPWRIRWEDHNWVQVICDDHVPIADCTRLSATNEANARLMAAAPDLLEALELIALQKHPVILQDPVNWQDVANTFVGIARAALAKARETA